jgi:hypothetical protein
LDPDHFTFRRSSTDAQPKLTDSTGETEVHISDGVKGHTLDPGITGRTGVLFAYLGLSCGSTCLLGQHHAIFQICGMGSETLHPLGQWM